MLLADEDESEENAAAYEEIEAKFRVTDAGQAQLLRTIPALADRYALGEVVDVVNVDTYYDAADLRLLRQGQTLRVRSAGDVVLLTAKGIGVHSPRGLHTRSETERQAPNIAADAQVLRPADLPGDVLAQAQKTQITVDHDAAGFGWFVDSAMPQDRPVEPLHSVPLADESNVAFEGVDLLTTLLHELGHVLGLGHSITPQDMDGVMADRLPPGVRRLEFESAIDELLSLDEFDILKRPGKRR